ncbi:transcription factor 7-like 1-C [Dunckerocampus dactyliophorus]|uniref:transcription factor 7-like 1-C n=1 Tax=Dunckerocampus dactyliophorus TaxID=161453 RepID=UPI002405920A|nr:transcription factor 7-like 1-C [Dunckerocampus dactyliophorus]XP_054620975.1 transcription factor 7-like 1-C [Dunckerocampus dactyliophorus]XP_054620976.1 transcription factor 7-like 1-C [Dunckerocampus dactyliophorus]XP_054620977.1 transcription factor 7-like 1-C [Dunckerocampus dactyliophorus]XP_054620978.1 transcription factor 7-like 1-C [Dunckerocampus dactyliophorus]XP_054620979.1 transcription factor 7-like 1-C [Dunckerocampus dactyliophorus]XP_054620980.1 transcription factor 7-lik
MMRAPSGMMMTPGTPQMVPVGFMNGEILFEQVHPLMSAAPPQNIFTSINSRKTEHVRDRPYIKKPPNAFMLFANKYREIVTMQLEKRDSASVHVALGKMWKLLPQADRDKYYEEADAQKRRHAQLYPRWSTCENYGKRRKRRKSKLPTNVSKDTPDPELPHVNSMSMCLAPVQSGLMGSEELDSSSATTGADTPDTMHYSSQPPSALSSEESVDAATLEEKYIQLPCVNDDISIAPDGQTQAETLENDQALNLLDCMLLSPASQIELQSVGDGFQLLLEHFEPEPLALHTETEESGKVLGLEESQQFIIKLFDNPALPGNIKVETQLGTAVQGHTITAGSPKLLSKYSQTMAAGAMRQEVNVQIPLEHLEIPASMGVSVKEEPQLPLAIQSREITKVSIAHAVHYHTAKTESSSLASIDKDLQVPTGNVGNDLTSSAGQSWSFKEERLAVQSQKLRLSIQSLENLSGPLPHFQSLSSAEESREGDLLQCLSLGDELQLSPELH